MRSDALAFVVVACASACGPARAPSGGTVHVVGTRSDSTQQEAGELARAIVLGSVTITLRIDALRAHPFAAGLMRMGGLQKTFDLAGIDALEEIDRAFIASPNASSCRTAIVIRHHMSSARVDEAFELARTRSEPPGARVDGLGFPAVIVTIGKQRRILAAPLRDHLLVLPENDAPRAGELSSSRGLDAGGDTAAFVLHAQPEAWTPFPPIFPYGIRSADAWIALDAGGARGTVELFDDSNDDARDDAAVIDADVHEAIRTKLLGLDVDLLHMRWWSSGDRVRGTASLGSAALRALLLVPFDRC